MLIDSYIKDLLGENNKNTCLQIEKHIKTDTREGKYYPWSTLKVVKLVGTRSRRGVH